MAIKLLNAANDFGPVLFCADSEQAIAALNRADKKQ